MKTRDGNEIISYGSDAGDGHGSYVVCKVWEPYFKAYSACMETADYHGVILGNQWIKANKR